MRSVAVLVGGTAFAHAITALALPILTRLYSPTDFSVLAVFASVLAVISVAACLRLDVAIALPASDHQAFDLLVLALACTAGVATMCGAIVLFAPEWFASTIGRSDIEPYLWMIPIGVLLAGTYSALQNWFVREKQFSLIARSRVVQSGASAGTQIGMSGLASAPIGLLVGYLLNTGSACIGLGFQLVRQQRTRRNGEGMNVARLKQAWKDHDRFPKYSTWEALCNSAAIQVPVIMIAALAAGPEAGYLLLAMSVIQAPMSLFGTAIGQVYLSRAPQAYRDGQLASFTKQVLGGLIKAGVGPLLLMGALAPFLFGLVFGEEWERAGVLVAWMTPWFVMQFLASPISMAMYITGRQQSVFLLQVSGLAFRIMAVWFASILPNAPMAEAYAVSGMIFYIVYLWFILQSVRDEIPHSLDVTPNKETF
ncbi:oligosaccharide flippase family protein [Hydrogenophaga sp.]|uniref:lipopolysaccharide biosynthesis protein n=1 Tax=Hydrogenophaga sp. TaxID=1904254 RepID=UPI0025C008C1|nr:oligosaccharide flippase family protein [Hydrogenophaga sp.]MBT9463738.1 oligosaccharide flippase family protein [Hydrogenophaga sp.]